MLSAIASLNNLTDRWKCACFLQTELSSCCFLVTWGHDSEALQITSKLAPFQSSWWYPQDNQSWIVLSTSRRKRWRLAGFEVCWSRHSVLICKLLARGILFRSLSLVGDLFSPFWLELDFRRSNCWLGYLLIHYLSFVIWEGCFGHLLRSFKLLKSCFRVFYSGQPLDYIHWFCFLSGQRCQYR